MNFISVRRRTVLPRLCAAVIIALSLGASVSVHAAQIPGPLVPGRQTPEYTAPPEPKSTPTPSLTPTHRQQAPESAKQITFMLKSITLDGAKALRPGQLHGIWQPYLGKTISVATLFDIVNTITKRYADAGYALSFAVLPEQKIADGNVTIKVIEGFVDKISYAGDGVQSPQGAAVERLANKITASRPLRTADLERYMLLINDLPGITAHGTFAASQTTQEASTLALDVHYQMVNASVSINDRLPKTLGRGEMVGIGTLNGLPFSSASLQVQQQCGFFCDLYHDTSLAWSQFVGAEGVKLGASIDRSDDKPRSDLFTPLDFRGTGTTIDLTADYALLRSRQTNFTIGSGLTSDDVETTTFAGILTRDHLRYGNLNGTYDYADSTGAVSLARLEVTQGISGLGASRSDDPLKSRANASATFTTAKLHALRNQPLDVFSGRLNGFSAYFEGEAQYDITNPLLSSVQCSYGGAAIGRGYDSGAISGDSCAMGLAELRYDNHLTNTITIQPYAFADAGLAWQKGALAPGENRSSGGQSVGTGVRYLNGSLLKGDLIVAVPIRKSLSEDEKGDPRLFFSVTLSY